MKLSILICSIFSRKNFLDRLLNVLEKQKTDDVEILVNSDFSIKKIGEKRNELLDMAQGDYLCFIDDDDLVSDDYISSILDAIKDGPDCVGIEGIMTTNGQNPKKFIHSLRYSKWYEKNGVYLRCPNHLSPIKSSIAKTVRFPEISHGEDKIYSEKIYSLLKKETYIDRPIYYYLYNSKPSKKTQELMWSITLNKPFVLTTKIKIFRLNKSASSFFINDSNFGFDGNAGGYFKEGFFFNECELLSAEKNIKENTLFNFVFEIRDNIISAYIDGINVLKGKNICTDNIYKIGFRNMRGKITLENLNIEYLDKSGDKNEENN